jgi:two-component system, OmpR family, manganese sensing sensor histidine kinase
LQTFVREGGFGPLALERRLLLSYLVVFAAIFIIAAVIIRFAFVAIIDRQAATRLEDVARAGLRSILFVDDAFEIDKREISNKALLTRDEGLQWFDHHGRLLGVEGLAPDGDALVDGRRQFSVGKQSFDSVAVAILNPRTHQRVGTVRATAWSESEQRDIQYLDTGLFVGTLLAIAAGGVGGLALAHRAVRPVEQSFQRLREFTADASHELRGPLTAIASSADAALREPKRDPELDHSRFEAIGDAAKQMSRLTSDLLLLAGTDRSLERDLFVVDLDAALNKIVNAHRPRFYEAGIVLTLKAREPTIVYGNPDQIERILTNLVENALRYTPAGGRVTVETRKESSDVFITVRDTGVGIAPEHLERVFDRFWRADPGRSFGGSGLGLAIARALARRHGGDVNVTSRYGGGSTFVVSLPLKPHLER